MTWCGLALSLYFLSCCRDLPNFYGSLNFIAYLSDLSGLL